LNEISQRKFFDYLHKKGIKQFLGVPDSTMKHFIDQGLKKKKILITTREEEAIGIGSGMSLSGSKCVIFMQNAGFANSISTITSLVQMYRIPLIFLIGWRGYLSNDAPEHLHIGKIQKELLNLVNLKSKIVCDDDWKKQCDWALKNLVKKNSCALIIRREFND
jgi:sulfopyruvate decarboxylase TPP-binding subunit